MREHFRAIFSSYADIFFFQSGWIGAVILLITILNPAVALCGILAVIAAYVFARFVRMEPSYLESGYYTYNPLLVGMSLGAILELSPLTGFFVVSAGVMAFLLTILMANVFTTYLRLPILSLPFVISSSVAYLASRQYSNLQVAWERTPYTPIWLADLFDQFPMWLTGYFQSFGAILFLPSVLAGILFSGLVLFYSRILFLLSILGYFVGTGVRALMLGKASQAFGDVNSFNFILIAMAVGGVFLIPSLRSYLIACVAVVVSILVLDSMKVFMAHYGIPAFTLPFNLASLGFIYVLGLLSYSGVAQYIGRSPEETLENHLSDRLRYQGEQRTLNLPFSGMWTVWQGFDGGWTHKAKYKFAYDFVISDVNGNTFQGEGNDLDDYFCFNKPVLSPVRGRVVHVIRNLSDNSPGEIDESNNWGNLVILEDPRGFHVEISHFASDTIQVTEGEWVERGTILGHCGNSGYSPQPHIHIQVQATDRIGAETLPFSFVSYVDRYTYYANDLPTEKHQVEPTMVDKRLDAATTFLLDDVLEFDVLEGNDVMARVKFHVRSSPDGTFYFETDRGRLYFGKHHGTFYFYRMEGSDQALAILFLALPRLPLSHRNKLQWRDFVPVGLTTKGFQRVLARFLGAIWPEFARVEVTQRFVSPSVIESRIDSSKLNIHRSATVTLDNGISSVTLDNFALRRKPNEST